MTEQEPDEGPGVLPSIIKHANNPNVCQRMAGKQGGSILAGPSCWAAKRSDVRMDTCYHVDEDRDHDDPL